MYTALAPTLLLSIAVFASTPSPLEQATAAAQRLRDSTAGEALPQFRHALRDLAAQELDRGPADATKVLATVIAKAGLAYRPDAPAACGGTGDVRVEAVAGHPELRAVVVSLQVPAGADEALYLFERHGVAWRLAIALEAPTFTDGRQAREGLQYAVSPTDADGRWFVVATWGIPWPTSCWNSLHFVAVRPGNDPEHPVELGSGSRSDYRCMDQRVRIETSPTGFALAYWGWHEAEPGSSRVHIEQYVVDGHQLRQGPPTAATADGFPVLDGRAGAGETDRTELEEAQTAIV